MSFVTKNVAEYVNSMGINIAKMSRDTGIPYRQLLSSLKDDGRERSLRDDEMIAICSFLKVNPMDFAAK